MLNQNIVSDAISVSYQNGTLYQFQDSLRVIYTVLNDITICEKYSACPIFANFKNSCRLTSLTHNILPLAFKMADPAVMMTQAFFLWIFLWTSRCHSDVIITNTEENASPLMVLKRPLIAEDLEIFNSAHIVWVRDHMHSSVGALSSFSIFNCFFS